MLTKRSADFLLTELLAPALQASGVLVAVSGGPDSMALLELAARWREDGAARPPIFAATVDHGLREDSKAEARMVADYAARCAIPHAILPWRGAKPTAGLQEKAREARYGLLVDEARARGADFILTAHHADDQAETILMRLLRGSAVAGLAGMSALSLRDGLTLFRPFLGLRKAALVAFCECAAIPFVRDSSNENPRFGRTGARRLAAMLEAEGLGPGEWARLARRAARAEAALAAATAAALEALPVSPDGALPFAALRCLPEEIALRCLAALARAAGGRDALRLERLESAFERLAEAQARGAALALTLAGAQIRLGRGGILTFSREPARRRGQGGARESQSVHVNAGNSGVHGVTNGPSLGNRPARA